MPRGRVRAEDCSTLSGTALYAFPVRSGGENESGALFARQYAASIKYS